MKKLLALVLALVMTLGLATVGANAAAVKYADAESINYTEAVDVMSAIGVLGGDETGFRPADTLKRSEGAKIVAYLLLGNKAAEAMQGTGAKFTDLPANHWAAGYMEYLASVGVMGGVGDGKIDPDGQLTATAFAKMLLTALGYDAKIEGFGGPDWSINVQKIANLVGIFDGNSAVVGTAAVTREEAALYAFNTIKAPLVEYAQKGNTLSVNGATIDFAASNYNYVTTTIANEQRISEDKLTNDGGYLVEFAEKYYPDLRLTSLSSVKQGSEYGLDDFGRPMRRWTYNNASVGTYVVKSALVYTSTKKVTAKELYDLPFFGKTAYDSLVAGRTNLTAFIDGAVTAYQISGSAAVIDPWMSQNDTFTVNGTGNGSVTEVYLDDDRNIDIVTINTYVLQAAADYNSTKKTLTLATAGDTDSFIRFANSDLTLSANDFDIADYKADDYVLVNAYTNRAGTASYKIDSIAKAELLTGTVERIKTDTNVTLDGTEKSYSLKTTKGTDDNASDEPVKSTAYSVGQKATVVLDKNGYIIAVDEAIVAENFVYVAKFAGTDGLNTKISAAAYFTDGSSDTITVKALYDIDGNKVTSALAEVNGFDFSGNGGGHTYGVMDKDTKYAGWYMFSKNDAGEYTLNKVPNGYAQAAYLYTWDTNIDAGRAYNIVNNDRVNFLMKDLKGNNDQNHGVDTMMHGEFDVTAATSLWNQAGTQAKLAETIRANDNTIFVITNGDDVYTYTGVKNVPDITLKDANGVGGSPLNAAGRAAVVVAYKNSNSYASYVFISTEGNVAIDDASQTGLVYVISKEGEYKTSNSKTYYQYKVLDGTTTVNKESTVEFAANEDNIYEAYYKVRENKNGEYTSGEQINAATGTGGTRFIKIAQGVGSISRSAGTITFTNANINTVFGNPTNDVLNLALADDFQFTVITLKAAGQFNQDRAETYEVNKMTARQLAAMVDGKQITYSVQGRVVDAWNGAAGNVLAEAYVTINTATATANVPVATYDTATKQTQRLQAILDIGETNTVTADGKITLNDDVTVGRYDTLTITGADLQVNKGATLDVYGTVNVGRDLINKGNINIYEGGSVIVTRNMDDTGHIEGAGTLTVNGNTVDISGSSLVVLDGGVVNFPEATVTVKGNLTVADGGALNIATKTNDTGKLVLKKGADVSLDGTVVIGKSGDTASTNTLVVEKDASLTVESGADLDVYGKLDIAEGATIVIDADDVKVTGNATVNAVVTGAGDGLNITGTTTTNSAAATEALAALGESTSVTTNANTINVVFVGRQMAKLTVSGASIEDASVTSNGSANEQTIANVSKDDALIIYAESWLSTNADFQYMSYSTKASAALAASTYTAIAGNNDYYSIDLSKVSGIDTLETLYVNVGTPTTKVTVNSTTPGTDTVEWDDQSSAGKWGNASAGASGNITAKLNGGTQIEVPIGAELKITAVATPAQWGMWTFAATGESNVVRYSNSSAQQLPSNAAFTVTVADTTASATLTMASYTYKITKATAFTNGTNVSTVAYKSGGVDAGETGAVYANADTDIVVTVTMSSAGTAEQIAKLQGTNCSIQSGDLTSDGTTTTFDVTVHLATAVAGTNFVTSGTQATIASSAGFTATGN